MCWSRARSAYKRVWEGSAQELTRLRSFLIFLILILFGLLPLALFSLLGFRFRRTELFVEEIIGVDLGRRLRCADIPFGVGSFRVRSFTWGRTIGEGYIGTLLLFALFLLGRLDRGLYLYLRVSCERCEIRLRIEVQGLEPLGPRSPLPLHWPLVPWYRGQRRMKRVSQNQMGLR